MTAPGPLLDAPDVGESPARARSVGDQFVDRLREEQMRYLESVAAESESVRGRELQGAVASMAQLTRQFFDAQRAIVSRVAASSGRATWDAAAATDGLRDLLDEWWSSVSAGPPGGRAATTGGRAGDAHGSLPAAVEAVLAHADGVPIDLLLRQVAHGLGTSAPSAPSGAAEPRRHVGPDTSAGPDHVLLPLERLEHAQRSFWPDSADRPDDTEAGRSTRLQAAVSTVAAAALMTAVMAVIG